MIGECKLWKAENGYGFLRTDDGPDIFCHVSQLRGYSALVTGQKVRFSTGMNPKSGRECAIDVELLAPIISPVDTPRSLRAEPDVREDRRSIAEAAFMRR